MTPGVPTIALFGLFGVNNIGNEATLAATMHALRARLPNVRIILISSHLDPAAGVDGFAAQIDPDPFPIMRYVRRFRPVRFRDTLQAALQLATESLRVRRARVQARGIDLLLIPGTGIADDFGQGPYDIPVSLARWCSVAQDLGIPVRFASIGAGPVTHPLSRRWFADALRSADFRSYREQSSKAFALEVGVEAQRDPISPDIVFSLPVADELSSRQVTWPPRTIGLGVMGYAGWNVDAAEGKKIYASFMARLAALAESLLDRGYAIHLLIGNRSRDKQPVRELTDLIRQRRKTSSPTVVAREIESYVDLLEEIARTDLVIASRFHNVLLALLLGKPAISLGYANKNNELMNEMGLADYCHSAESFQPAQVVRQVEQMASMPEAPVGAAKSRLAEYRRALDQQYEGLLRGL